MATGKQLAILLRVIRRDLQSKVPAQIGQAMLEETQDNFEKEQYGNDETPEKWRDRYGYIRKKGLVNAEPYLRYKKLNYTGRLLRGIKWSSGAKFARLSSSAPYSEDHNEGTTTFVGGGVMRKPPKSITPIKLGSSPYKRQFMGVGKRTVRKVQQLYDKQIKRLL